jgi:hypothetical protein
VFDFAESATHAFLSGAVVGPLGSQHLLEPKQVATIVRVDLDDLRTNL